MADMAKDMKTNLLTFYLAMLFIVLYMYFYVFTLLKAARGAKPKFNKEFMSQFNEEWAAAFPGESEAPAGGSPDDGNGYFSQKLSYKDWYQINKQNRVYLHSLEQMPMVIFPIFICSLRYPLLACIYMALMLLGRVIFSIGYMKKGPMGRLLGLPIYMLGGFFPAIITSFVAIFSIDPESTTTFPPMMTS